MADATFRPGLRALILTRFREFFREPEAVFWVYVFPILLATGLGIAFRSRPPERVPVGWGAWSHDRAELLSALEQDSTLQVRRYDDSAAADAALRNGKVALLVLPGNPAVG